MTSTKAEKLATPSEPQEHRIPIEDRPKAGEIWRTHMGWGVTILEADVWGRSFKYERTDEAGHQKFGQIGQTEVLDGRAFRIRAVGP